jgi:hypothetical protein
MGAGAILLNLVNPVWNWTGFVSDRITGLAGWGRARKAGENPNLEIRNK